MHAMSPPLRGCEAGEPYCISQWLTGTNNLRDSPRSYHLVSIWPRDSDQLHHRSESFVHGFIVSRDLSYIGSLHDLFVPSVSVRMSVSYLSLEQLRRIVFGPELVILSGVLIHTTFFRSASVSGH
jgi:hypothetical protein